MPFKLSFIGYQLCVRHWFESLRYFSDKVEVYVTVEYLRKQLVLVIKGEMRSIGGVDCDFQSAVT